jgi:hypothetical protein
MIRLATTALAALALLAGAVLWFPQSPAPQELARAATPWLHRAADLADRAGQGAEPEGEGPAGPGTLPAAPEPVQRLDPPASLPFDDGMEEAMEAPEARPTQLGEAPPVGPTQLAEAPDQQAWAGLIRRMLAIYQRVGAGE